MTLSGQKIFEWYGKSGRTYFMQVSDVNSSLAKWKWVPLIESGNDEPISYEVDATAAKGFFRLQRSDLPILPGLTPDTADFDNDGLNNLAEITPVVIGNNTSQTNPLDPDTDHDGLFDKWERDHGLDPTDDGSVNPNNGPNGDPDGDGLSNIDEQTHGTDPNDIDTDGDGANDGDEIKSGHDPLSDQSYPPVWRKARRTIARDLGVVYSYAGWDSSLGEIHYEETAPGDYAIILSQDIAFPTAPPSQGSFNLQEIRNGGSCEGTIFANLDQTRFWLETKPAVTEDYKFSVIQRTKRGPGSTFDTTATTTCELKSITIHANNTLSDPLDVLPTFTSDNQKVETILMPVEVMVPDSVSLSMGTDPSSPRPEVTYRPATEVSIATWENSFQHNNSEDLVRWWLLNDSDHVKIRIPRPDKIGLGPLKVTIATTNPPEYVGAFDDAPNEVNLKESVTEPGIFENTFLLVSNDVDDAIGGTDGGFDDQTHKITVGGELIVTYGGHEISRLKVREKGRIKLRPMILWYSGLIGGNPAVPISEVLEDVKDIRRRFAQAGIAVEWDGEAWGIDVNLVTGASDHFMSDGIETLDGTAASGDETALSVYIDKTYPTAIGAKEILIIYSSVIYGPSFFGGIESFPRKAYTLIPSLASTLGVRPMIVTTANRSVRFDDPVSHTLAHETLHMLLDDVHPIAVTGKHDIEFGYNRRLWSGGPNRNQVTDRVRMSKIEVDHVVGDIQKSPLIKP